MNSLSFALILTPYLLLSIDVVFGKPRHHMRQSENLNNLQNTIKVISTNTRSGYVDVDAIVNSNIGNGVFDTSVVPDNIYHGAVQGYGKIFDFILNEGIKIEDDGQYYERNSPLWIDSEFNTTRSENEFLDWIKKVKGAKYTVTSYRLADNNCLTFVADALEFLGGKEPMKLRTQRKFAINNRKNADVLQALYEAAKPPSRQTPPPILA